MKRLAPLALLAFLTLLYLPALGNASSGSHPDESYYLGISAEMAARGAWLTPTLDGVNTWFKPPLLYWAERICYGAFGRGFFGGRLPAALAAMGLALVTGALARRMYGDRAALLASVLTATTFGFLKFGRMAMMDAPMALALAVAAYGTWRAAEEGKVPAVLLAGVGAGAAFMLKGPVGAVLVLLASGGFVAVRAPRLLASRWTAAAFGVGAAIGLPWYVASFAVHGRAFYDFFVVSQNLDRFRHPWTLSGELVLLVGFLVFLMPWTILFLAALPSLRKLREPGVLLPVLWIASVLLTFTIPSLKWPHYGLTCAPAAILLAVRAAPPRWARAATGVCLALLAGVVLLALRWRFSPVTTSALVACGALFATSAVLVFRERLAAGAVAGGAAVALVLAVVIPGVNPPVVPPEARAALERYPLHVYDSVPGIFTMSVGRPVRRALDGAQIAAALQRGEVVILGEGALGVVPPADRARLVTVARWPHIPGYLPAGAVWRAWISRDERPLFESMLAVAEAGAPRADAR